MVQKPIKKGATSTVRKVVLYMPVDLAKALKVYVAEKETNMSAFVNTLVEQAIKRGGREKK